MIGIILAGGSATRLGGGDKGALRVGGLTIIERVVATMRAQCDAVVVNAAGDPSRFAHLACPVVADAPPAGRGPLAGILAGLDYAAAHHPRVEFAVSVPTDAPFLPTDLVARLEDRREEDRAAIVRAGSAGRAHHVVALWSVALRDDLRRALDGGERRVGAFAARHPVATVAWPVAGTDPFFNVNTPQDLETAQEAARSLSPR